MLSSLQSCGVLVQDTTNSLEKVELSCSYGDSLGTTPPFYYRGLTFGAGCELFARPQDRRQNGPQAHHGVASR